MFQVTFVAQGFGVLQATPVGIPPCMPDMALSHDVPMSLLAFGVAARAGWVAAGFAGWLALVADCFARLHASAYTRSCSVCVVLLFPRFFFICSLNMRDGMNLTAKAADLLRCMAIVRFESVASCLTSLTTQRCTLYSPLAC